MKVFISQPMKGLSDEEILSKRNEAISKIKEKFGDDDLFNKRNEALKYLAKFFILMILKLIIYLLRKNQLI